MDDLESKMIKFLCSNANPSIKKRINDEIMQCYDDVAIDNLKNQILQEKIIRIILESQNENGWFGNNLHGSSARLGSGQFDNQEVGIKYLMEKGIDSDSEVIARAMDSYCTTQLTDICYGTRGKYFDEFKYAANGQNLIRCSGIARAGYEDKIDISSQIQLALDSFRRVLEVDSIMDVTRFYPRRKVYLFNDNEKWPCQYHLMILAYTYSWRTEENILMLAKAIRKILACDNRVETASWVGYPLGTLGAFSDQVIFPFNPEDVNCWWFQRMEQIARCEVIKYIPELQKEVEKLDKSITEEGSCQVKVFNKAFTGWGPYGGLQLETDWKSKIKRYCDITFRALLIHHYSQS